MVKGREAWSACTWGHKESEHNLVIEQQVLPFQPINNTDKAVQQHVPHTHQGESLSSQSTASGDTSVEK